MNHLISPEVLRTEQTAGQAPTIVDVRSPNDYAAGHIPGAVNIPAVQVPTHLAEIPRDRPVVVY